MNGLKLRAWVLVALIGVAGCEGSGGVPSGPSAAVIRDNPGVTLVESHPGEAPPRYIARLDSSYLRLGVLERGPAYRFLAVTGLRGLDGGGMLVAAAAARELRVYDASGSHVRTFGSEGDQLGEFVDLSGLVGVAGDTVWAWDARSQRLTSYLTSGELVGTVQGVRDPGGRGSAGRITELHRLDDGTYVARSLWSTDNRGSPESDEVSLVRDSIVLRHLDTTLRELDTIAVLPWAETLRRMSVVTSGSQIVSLRMGTMPRPFGRTSYFYPRLSGVVTGTNDSYEWMLRAPDGAVQLISWVPDFHRPISPGQVTELRDWFLSTARTEQRTLEIEAFFDDFPLPERAPAFGTIHVDASGRVWLAEYEAVRYTESVWMVFSPDGQLLGRVEVPTGLEIHEIGSDYLLGVLWEGNVPYVLRFPLVEID